MKPNSLYLLIEILVFGIIVYLDSIEILPISQTIYLIPVIWITLRLKKEKFSSIGFSFKEVKSAKAIALGIGLGIAMELFALWVTTPFISDIFNTEPDLSELQQIQGNIAMMLIFILLSWIMGAFGEEICFRGYLMNRIAKVTGDGKASWIVALVLSSVLFGWGHTEQGISGWIQEGLSGLLLGIFFLASGKKLAVPIIAHGTSNTLAFVLIYLGQYPGVGL